MNRRIKLVGSLAAVILVFYLAGFLPEYIRAHTLQGRVDQADLQLETCRVLDLSGMTFLETSLKNYGLASRYSSRWFNAAKALASQTKSAELRQALASGLARRDTITAQLARGDEAAYGSVQAAYQALLTYAVASQ
ncbi:MAG TPA: hypothetical protein VME17_20560 [Bryobacteraceae bacterium]|nr:hypothetical protein [Bryobacteraceae bacterium]